jgi:hypothetical protein
MHFTFKSHHIWPANHLTAFQKKKQLKGAIRLTIVSRSNVTSIHPSTIPPDFNDPTGCTDCTHTHTLHTNQYLGILNYEIRILATNSPFLLAATKNVLHAIYRAFSELRV